MDETGILSAMVNKTLNKVYFQTAMGREVDLRVNEGPEGHLEAISGPVWGMVWRSILGHI